MSRVPDKKGAEGREDVSNLDTVELAIPTPLSGLPMRSDFGHFTTWSDLHRRSCKENMMESILTARSQFPYI